MLTLTLSILCLAIGYVAGSMRTYASCDYWDESLGSILSTLKPWCGSIRARLRDQ